MRGQMWLVVLMRSSQVARALVVSGPPLRRRTPKSPKGWRLVGGQLSSLSSREEGSELEIPGPSAVHEVEVRGRRFMIKRDDQWRLTGALGAGVGGNKARKLLEFALEGPTSGAVASMGGHQSNAMVAMAALCRARGVGFTYLAKPVPRWLRRYPAGNYARALALGVDLVPLRPDVYRRCAHDVEFRTALLADLVESDVVWLPQGGACAAAERGVALLATELLADFQDADKLRIVVPAGTGTTALFLARHLAPSGARVFAVPCATRGPGLAAQMRDLDRATGDRLGVFPAVLDLKCRPTEPRFRFGAPSEREWRVWTELRTAGLFLDLVYAPHTWDVLLRALETPPPDLDPHLRPLSDPDALIVYLHCGGLEGVATQLTRYRREGFNLDADGRAHGGQLLVAPPPSS